jgi:hypothetical protein
MLKFSNAMDNAKLKKLIDRTGKQRYTFSLPSGWSCPGADKCLAKVIVDKKGKATIQDGKNIDFRCYSASQEALYPSVRKARKHNFDLLRGKSSQAMAKIILDSLPIASGIIRLHVGGDFFNQNYFDAWLLVAQNCPSITFYAYTKSIPFWVARLGKIPQNMVLTASKGGKYDTLIDEYSLPNSTVFFSEEQAELADIPLDTDDSMALYGVQSFGHLVHGMQPKASDAGKAVVKLAGKGSYSSKKK